MLFDNIVLRTFLGLNFYLSPVLILFQLNCSDSDGYVLNNNIEKLVAILMHNIANNFIIMKPI